MAFTGANHFTISGGEINNVAGNYAVNFGEDPLEKFQRLFSAVHCGVKHRKVKSVIRTGTSAGEWLLRHEVYNTWKEERSQARLLWLTGVPGAGKTVLSSIIIDDLRRNHGIAVTFFYCEFQDPVKRDPTNVLASLLGQLLHKVSRISPAVISLLEQYPNPQSAHEFDLPELILLFASEFKKTFIVIDAVDECEDLIQLLPILTDLAVEINVFATSRDKADIRDEFKDCGKLVIGRDDINDDVRHFVETDVKRINVGNPELAQNIIDRLISGAQGTFLWPSFHMQQLRKLRTDHDIQNALNNLPQGMEDTLLRALGMINMHPNSERLRWVLRLVVCAVRPLTLEELAEGVATVEMNDVWDPTRVVNDPTSLIDDCANLLMSIPGTFSWLVIPFHVSVKEFLLANPVRMTGKLLKFSLHPQSVVHTDLARLCLSYLKLKCIDGSLSLGQISDYPFALYAIEGWIGHMRASGTDVLFREFREFLAPGSETLRVWAALYQELGAARLHDRGGVKDNLHRLDAAHLAVRLDLPMMIQHFTLRELTAEDHSKLTPLCVAVERSSSLTLVEKLLERVDVNQVSGYGETALHIVSSYEDIVNPVAVVQRLLEAGADPELRNEEGQVALHLLMDSPRRALSCMPLLLQYGADINVHDADSRTPLHLAAEARMYEEVRFLSPGDEDGTSPEYTPITQDYIALLECLLNRGANLHCLDKKRNSPLHYAARNGNAFAVEFFLKTGADVNMTNNAAYTPLHLAVTGRTSTLWSRDAESHQKRIDCELTVKHLLKYGADINARIRAKQQSLLHIAASSCCQLSIVTLLVNQGAAANSFDLHHITPLHLAAKMAPILDSHDLPQKWRISWVACRKIFEILLTYIKIDERGWDTLRTQVLQLLSKTNLRLGNRSSLTRKTIVAGRGGKTDEAVQWFNGFLKLLCSHGANVNTSNYRGHNVLQYAVLFWASWMSKYHATLLSNEAVWGPDETKEAADLEWTRILQLMSLELRGRPSIVPSREPSQKKRRLRN